MWQRAKFKRHKIVQIAENGKNAKLKRRKTGFTSMFYIIH